MRGWSDTAQARLYEILDDLCRDPKAGRYYEDTDSWVYKEGARPQITVDYRLDPEPRLVTVDSVGQQIIEYREILIFLSYSREDRTWFEKLRKALEPLADWDIRIWCDQDINPAQEWLDVIREKLGSTSAALLLISSTFLTSEFIRSHELPTVLDRAEERTEPPFLLLWVPLTRQDTIERDLLGRRLLKFQALLNPKTPLNAISRWKIGRTLRKLTEEVSRVVYRELRRRPV
jgi:hypothetical protein